MLPNIKDISKEYEQEYNEHYGAIYKKKKKFKSIGLIICFAGGFVAVAGYTIPGVILFIIGFYLILKGGSLEKEIIAKASKDLATSAKAHNIYTGTDRIPLALNDENYKIYDVCGYREETLFSNKVVFCDIIYHYTSKSDVNCLYIELEPPTTISDGMYRLKKDEVTINKNTTLSKLESEFVWKILYFLKENSADYSKTLLVKNGKVNFMISDCCIFPSITKEGSLSYKYLDKQEKALKVFDFVNTLY